MPLLLSMLVLLAVLPYTLIVGQPALAAIPTTVQGTLFVALIAIGVSGWYLLPNPIAADIADEDERRTSEARAGGYTGLINLPLNLFQVWATLMAGLLMALPPAIPYTYSLGLLLWGPVAAFFVAISIPIAAFLLNTDPFC